MLIRNADDTFTSGPLDVVVLLAHAETERLHVCFFEEHPFPGSGSQAIDEQTVVHLKSKLHHATGAANFTEAEAQLKEFLEGVHVDPLNVYRHSALRWDGQDGLVYLVSNWRRPGAERPFDIREMAGQDFPVLTT